MGEKGSQRRRPAEGSQLVTLDVSPRISVIVAIRRGVSFAHTLGFWERTLRTDRDDSAVGVGVHLWIVVSIGARDGYGTGDEV